jgi:hypothetical protein
VFGEQALGKGVQRADGRPVELVQSHPAALPDLAFGIGLGLLLEPRSDAIAQLGAGLFGKRDGRNSPQLDPPIPHQGQHPPDEGGGLARPRPGFDEQGGVEVLGDPIARRLIGGHNVLGRGVLLKHRAAARIRPRARAPRMAGRV